MLVLITLTQLLAINFKQSYLTNEKGKASLASYTDITQRNSTSPHYHTLRYNYLLYFVYTLMYTLIRSAGKKPRAGSRCGDEFSSPQWRGIFVATVATNFRRHL